MLAVVFQEAIILAVLGFIPGFGVSIGMYGLLEALTQMPLAMQSHVALRVFFSHSYYVSGFWCDRHSETPICRSCGGVLGIG